MENLKGKWSLGEVKDSKGEVREPITIGADTLPVKGGLYDETIFGVSQELPQSYGEGDFTVLARFGETNSEDYGHIVLPMAFINPLGYDDIAKALHISVDDVKEIAHFRIGAMQNPADLKVTLGSVDVLIERHPKNIPDIMTGSVALMMYSEDANSDVYNQFISKVLVAPVKYRKAELVTTEFGTEFFEHNMLNDIYRRLIINSRSLSAMFGNPYAPKRMIWEAGHNIQTLLEELSKEDFFKN